MRILSFFSQVGDVLGRFSRRDSRGLYYFEDILPFEFAAIARRRRRLAEEDSGWPRAAEVHPVGAKPETQEADDAEEAPARKQSPEPALLFADAAALIESGGDKVKNPDVSADAADAATRAECPDRHKMRPMPVPCDATGLAFSGGGIRSAAVCIGAMQALDVHRRLPSIDYLSTVSGGGYAGACLSAAMSRKGSGAYPFAADVADSPAIAHLRNFSNYLMPRGRSGLRNLGDAAAVILRGLLANAVIVAAVLLACALLTLIAYAGRGAEFTGSMIPAFVDAILAFLGIGIGPLASGTPFGLTRWLALALAFALLLWAALRSDTKLDRFAGDTGGWVLPAVRALLIATLVSAVLDAQPFAIRALQSVRETAAASAGWWNWLGTIAGAVAAFTGTVATFASSLGQFLEASRQASGVFTLLRRGLAKLALVAAGLAMPLGLWLLYLWLCLRAIDGSPPSGLDLFLTQAWPDRPDNARETITLAYGIIFTIAAVISYALTANAYSLHRFYRDRLSKAFLFGGTVAGQPDPEELDAIKLSELEDTEGPYHIINAALNVQGSAEANRRGRNADFFMFTSQFVGSDLTLYVRAAAGSAETIAMERADPRLDLGTAMATSGAAISANMGSNTVRILSPTLALLNIRLGYWLRNPRDVASRNVFSNYFYDSTSRIREKLYLFTEMLNLHDERSAQVYLTDGGHIENLGLYELLKRGCQLIIVIDAEADQAMSFSSLLRVERYARIDLGVRITLPWEKIADIAKAVSSGLAAGERPCHEGPHAAVGRIVYQDGSEGVLLYFKSSVTGDEKDYLLDYKLRQPAFPHETTGDQFFSEEQFEMYRALGFHMVDRVFSGSDEVALLEPGKGGFASRESALERINQLLPPHGQS